MPSIVKYVVGFVGIGATALACSVSTGTGDGAPGAGAGAVDPQALVVGTSSGITYNPPEVLPNEYWTQIIAPAADGDLDHYFPVAPGSAAGGWTTGTCGTNDAFCQIDEYFSNYVGPAVPQLGANCRAAEAQQAWQYYYGGGFHTYYVPYSPASRAAGIIPLKQYCECLPQPEGSTLPEVCWEPAYVYVVCPLTDDLQRWASANSPRVGGITATSYLTYSTASYLPVSQSSTPQSTSNAVVYRIDPQCSGCTGTTPPCR